MTKRFANDDKNLRREHEDEEEPDVSFPDHSIRGRYLISLCTSLFSSAMARQEEMANWRGAERDEIKLRAIGVEKDMI